MAKSNSACPLPKDALKYDGKGTSWHIMMYISLVALCATTAISLSLIITHLRRYRAPKEQRQIIRIVFSVVVYSLVAFGELYIYEIAKYIDPIGDLYEAFGLCALFLLFIQYAAPSGTYNDEMFAAVKAAEEVETPFNWPRISWIFVFQYPIIDALCIALQEGTEAVGTYCFNSLNPKYAHLWVEITESISIGACVLAIWGFRIHMKRRFKVKRALSKLLCFKGIVFIRFTQQWVFATLLEYHAIKPSKEYSYDDILYGISATASCVEMVLFALAFWYAFSSTEYGSKAKPQAEPLPIWKAVLDAMNPWDLIVGMARIFPLCIEAKKTGDWSEWVKYERNQGVQGMIRKGIRKYKARKGKGEGRYQEMDEGLESLTKPKDMHHSRTGSPESYDMAAYHSPAGSPPEESNSRLGPQTGPGALTGSPYQGYLIAESAVPVGRSRASSQSSLGPDSQLQPGRPRSVSAGQRDAPQYGQSWAPPAYDRFQVAPTEGRDMV